MGNQNNTSRNNSNNNTNKNTNKNSNNNNTNTLKINNNTQQKINQTLKLPELPYQFYNHYLEKIDKKEKAHFEKPIGLYDPYGKNINPLTLQPYQNHYIKNKPISYNNGNLEGMVVPKSYSAWAAIWTNLKLYSITGQIIDSIRKNNITIIKAGTGVGKSFLAGRICSQAFNYQKKVLMTLPKKLLARETAETTAITCDVVLGEEVGYFYKGERFIDKNNKESKIIFTTVGSLIRSLTGDDPYLEGYDCIIVDEAHERSVQTDFLILFLKKALVKRKDLKVVFISATLDIKEFQNYYKGSSLQVVDMGETTSKEIKDYYEKTKPMDWRKTAMEKIMNILKSQEKGDIIVFIKARSDGNMMMDQLRSKFRNLPENKKNGVQENPFMIVLDAGISKDDKDYATKEFNYLNHPDADSSKPYTRKIVFATNVAESSLTVKGVVFVIDCGLALEDYYEPLKDANALLEKFVSKSAVKQRRGRAGRTMPGVCYHLYSEKEYATFPDFPIPSIQKSDLTMDILDIFRIPYIKDLGDVKKLLDTMMSPPEPKFMDSAIHKLVAMEALSGKESKATVTELGQELSKFSSINIQLSRAIVASYYYHCKYEVIPIVVLMEMLGGRIEGIYNKYRPDRRLSNQENAKEEKKFITKQHQFDNKYGDLLTLHNIYNAYIDYMKLPKEYNPSNENNNTNKNSNNQNGGNLNNNNNNSNKNNNRAQVSLEARTKKNYKDARDWCLNHGINPKYLVKKDSKQWNKIQNDSRQLDNTLMKIVRPAHLNHQHHQDYKNDGGTYSKALLKKEIQKNIEEVSNISPENKVQLQEDIDELINDTMKNREKSGGSFIQCGGFQKKSYERSFFPNINMHKSKEENILQSFSHGLYINMVKNQGNNKFVTCFPLEKTYCNPDPKSSVSLTSKPAYLMYYELFMMREHQKQLKLNVVSKMPTSVMNQVKKLYKHFIPDCYQKIILESSRNHSTSVKKKKKKSFPKK